MFFVCAWIYHKFGIFSGGYRGRTNISCLRVSGKKTLHTRITTRFNDNRMTSCYGTTLNNKTIRSEYGTYKPLNQISYP
jgi:hypothetical protein